MEEMELIQKEIIENFKQEKLIREEINGHISNLFNPFDRVKLDEPKLSKLLGTLLNKGGTHGQGDLFLKYFLEKIDPKYNSSDDWEVIAETAFVDLSLKNKTTGEVIIVENKHFGAVDQKHQLYRYWYQEVYEDKTINNESYKIIYLSKDGKKKHVLNSILGRQDLVDLTGLKILDENKIQFWGFRTEIKEIIDLALKEISPSNIRLRTFLDYYMEILRIKLRQRKYEVDRIISSSQDWENYLKLNPANYIAQASVVQELKSQEDNFRIQLYENFNNEMEEAFRDLTSGWSFDLKKIKPAETRRVTYYYSWSVNTDNKLPLVNFVLMGRKLVLRCGNPNLLPPNYLEIVKACFNENKLLEGRKAKFSKGKHILKYEMKQLGNRDISKLNDAMFLWHQSKNAKEIVAELKVEVEKLTNDNSVKELLNKLQKTV